MAIVESDKYWHEDVYGSLDEIVKKDAIDRWIDKLFPDKVTGKSVLDVGCGGGTWTKYWIDKGCYVTAVDTSKDSVDITTKYSGCSDVRLTDMITTELGKQFDIIFAKDIIEHVKNDKELLANFYKHLKKGGLLLVFTHNSLSVNYYVEGFYHYICGNVWIGYHPEHVRFYRPDTLTRKIKDAGFVPAGYFGSYHVPYRFVTTALFRNVIEWKVFHIVDYLHLNNAFPFNKTGWSIGVAATK